MSFSIVNSMHNYYIAHDIVTEADQICSYIGIDDTQVTNMLITVGEIVHSTRPLFIGIEI